MQRQKSGDKRKKINLNASLKGETVKSTTHPAFLLVQLVFSRGSLVIAEGYMGHSMRSVPMDMLI